MTTILNITDNLRIRWREPFLTEGLNKKMFGTVRPGVYDGFYVKANGVNGILEIIPEPEHLSILATTSSIVADTDPDYWILQDTGAVFTEADLLRSVQPALAANPLTNAGPFLITEIVSSTQIKIYSSTAIAEPAGTMTWTIDNGNNSIAHIADDTQGLSGTINVNGVLTTPDLFSDPNSSAPLAAGGTFWLALDFSYSKGADSTASIQFIFDSQEFVSSTRLLRLCQIDVPPAQTKFTQSQLSQVTRSDFANPLWTTRPWATAAESGLAHPGYRRITIPYVQDFGTSAVNYVTLSGKFYVGSVAARRKYFAFAEVLSVSSYEKQLLGAENYPVVVFDVLRASGAAITAADIDAEGFVDGVRVSADFTSNTNINFLTITPRILAYKEAAVGRLTGEQTSREPVRGFAQHAQDIPVAGGNFTHIPTTVDDVQQALENIEAGMSGLGSGFVTVGPPGSGASYRSDLNGSDVLAFQAAVSSLITTNGGQVYVLPGQYTFDDALVIALSNVRISGAVQGNVDSLTSAVVIRATDAWRGNIGQGGLIQAVNVHNIVIEDIVFRDDATVTSAAYRGLLYFEKTTGGGSVGPTIQRCCFVNATKASSSVVVLTSGAPAGAHFEKVVIEDCTLQATQAQDKILVELVDVAQYSLARNILTDSTNAQTQAVFNIYYSVYTNRVFGVIENNYVDAKIEGISGAFVAATVPGTSAQDSVLRLSSNRFETRSNPTTASGLVFVQSLGSNRTCVVVEDNTILSRNGGTAPVFRMSGHAQQCDIRNNYLSADAAASLKFVEAVLLTIEGNTLIGAGVPSEYFDVTPVPRNVVIRGNYWELSSGSVTSVNAAVRLPANTVLDSNVFVRTGISDFVYGFLIRAGSVVRSNTFTFSSAGITRGTAILLLGDGSGGVVQSIRVESNLIECSTGLSVGNTPAGIALYGAAPSTVEQAIVANNIFTGVRACVDFGSTAVQNSVVSGNTSASVLLGVLASSASFCSVLDNVFSYRDADVGDTVYGVLVGADCIVARNAFEGHLTPGTIVTDRHVVKVGDRCYVGGNESRSVYNTNIGLEAGSDAVVVDNVFTQVGNTVVGTDVVVVKLTGSNNVCSNNHIFAPNAEGVGVTLSCVELVGSHNSVVGNVIRQPEAKTDAAVIGILVSGSDCSVQGNVISRVRGKFITGVKVDGSYAQISDNHLTDVLASVAGATVVGVEINNDPASVKGNIINGLECSLNTVAAIQINTDYCEVSGNQIVALVGGAYAAAIEITDGQRHSILGNAIRSVAGVPDGIGIDVQVTAKGGHLVNDNNISDTTRPLLVSTAAAAANYFTAVGNTMPSPSFNTNPYSDVNVNANNPATGMSSITLLNRVGA